MVAQRRDADNGVSLSPPYDFELLSKLHCLLSCGSHIPKRDVQIVWTEEIW